MVAQLDGRCPSQYLKFKFQIVKYRRGAPAGASARDGQRPSIDQLELIGTLIRQFVLVHTSHLI